MLATVGLCLVSAALPNDTKCNFHGGNVDWINNATLENAAGLKQMVPKVPPHIQVNLDLPPKDRWYAALSPHKDLPKQITAYLDELVPKWAVLLLENALGPLADYRGFGEEYSQEIDGIATALDTNRGQIVACNLMYVLENIGINCSNWNDTGPTGECKNDTDVVYPFKTKIGGGVTGPPGTCTSIVAQRPDGKIVHGRNFDWNIPEVLRDYLWEVEFYKNGSKVFTGTSIATYIGVQNAMKGGKGGFALTMDARCQGGKLLENIIEMLLEGGKTPSLLARDAMTHATSYDDLVDKLSNDPLIAPMYFITSGSEPGQGAVIARERRDAIDVWKLNVTEPNGWWRLETNYDRWQPVPAADDRRGPGNAHIEALGQDGINPTSMYDVLVQWPTFNAHTDHTAVFVVADDYYNTTAWYGTYNGTL